MSKSNCISGIDLELTIPPPPNHLFGDREARIEEGFLSAFTIVIGLRAGLIIRPPRKTWFQTTPVESVWRQRIVLPILPFLSIGIGRWGFYVGFKDFGYDPTYALNGIWPDGKLEDRALCPSIRFTTNRDERSDK